MDFSNPPQRAVFMEIHSGLPRESCGSDASTLRALAMVVDRLPENPQIADMACGPGSSAIPLAAALPDARILAIDLHAPFIEETQRRAKAGNLSDRVEAIVGDMTKPPSDPNSLDMIWCEGGIYNVGVAAGLSQWKTFLKPDGIVVFNEPIWLVPAAERPKEITEFWAAYPAMTNDHGICAVIAEENYTLLGSFDLPDSDWWDAYYTPMETRISELEAKRAGNEDAAAALSYSRAEIAMRRAHASTYNYRFYCTALNG